MKSKKPLLVLSLILALLVVALVVPSVAQAKGAGNTIVVGTSPDYPPFENLKNGKIVGFDIDLVKEIGKRIGYKIEFRADEFNRLIPGIAAPPYAFDMVASALTITSGREEIMDFSDPYFYDSEAEYHYYGFGFPTGSPLRLEVNGALQQIKEDGSYTRLYREWFGAPIPTPVGTIVVGDSGGGSRAVSVTWPTSDDYGKPGYYQVWLHHYGVPLDQGWDVSALVRLSPQQIKAGAVTTFEFVAYDYYGQIYNGVKIFLYDKAEDPGAPSTIIPLLP
jgi:hypothetical protein